MGLYNPEDIEPLTTWLVKNLDAMQVFLNHVHSSLTVLYRSDAEPTALAKYILELLSMWSNDPESELKPRLVDLLTDFLQGGNFVTSSLWSMLTFSLVAETSLFVDRLLATLRSKSFLPYTTASEPPSVGQNQSQTRQPRSRKRGLEQDEQDKAQERELKGPPKGPRLQFEKQTRRQPPDGPRSRSQRRDDHDDIHSRDASSHQGRRDMRSDMGPAPPTGPRAGVPKAMCRDYYGGYKCNTSNTSN